ncbi:MAG TPA: radical SAM protein [Anaerolineales bacterium]|nr:radical SAM protein [Anaerolineales bacterium]
MPLVTTIDFHITDQCNQDCPYCWGPKGFPHEVGTRRAEAILRRVAELGIRRIVFTGGDPVLRPDLGHLMARAKRLGLEVALSTSGDALKLSALRAWGSCVDLISLPLDGPTERVSRRTKKPGHRAAILRDLRWLARFPSIDVKVCTPVTRRNLVHIPQLVDQLERLARRMPNRFFYNVFQAYPRAMEAQDWGDLIVDQLEFAELREKVMSRPRSIPIRWLDHTTLDRLYVMILPDGTLTVPYGPDYLSFGPFLELSDLDTVLRASPFDSEKHAHHAHGWSKSS